MNYTRTNWKLFREKVDNELIGALQAENNSWNVQDIDNASDTLNTAIISSLTDSTPKASIRFGIIADEDLRRLISKRNFHRRRFSRTRSPDEKELYYKLNKQIRDRTETLRRERYYNEIANCTSKNNNIFRLIKNIEVPGNHFLSWSTAVAGPLLP